MFGNHNKQTSVGLLQVPCHWKMPHIICKPLTPPRSPSERLLKHNLGASRECSQRGFRRSFPNSMLSFCSKAPQFQPPLHYFLPLPSGHHANTGTKLRSMISCGLGSLCQSWHTVTYILSRAHSLIPQITHSSGEK